MKMYVNYFKFMKVMVFGTRLMRTSTSSEYFITLTRFEGNFYKLAGLCKKFLITEF